MVLLSRQALISKTRLGFAGSTDTGINYLEGGMEHLSNHCSLHVQSCISNSVLLTLVFRCDGLWMVQSQSNSTYPLTVDFFQKQQNMLLYFAPPKNLEQMNVVRAHSLTLKEQYPHLGLIFL